MRLGRAGLILLAALLAAAAGTPDHIAELTALRAADLRVATIGYRLAAAGSAICPDHEPLTGLLLHGASQYDDDHRAAAIRLFGLADGSAVEAVVPDSPADHAGIAADDQLVAINGAAVPRATEQRGSGTPAEMLALRAQLLAALNAGPARLTLRRDGRESVRTLIPITGCASLIQLVTSPDTNVSSDGRLVTITTGLVNVLADDDTLAFNIGHELSHNILHTREQLDAPGGNTIERIRQNEYAADYVGVYLMARAGYHIAAAPAFWRGFGRAHSFGIFASPDHPSWTKRARALDMAVAEIEAKRARGEPLIPGHPPLDE